MNILSLFDGMSCGQIALNRVGIKYDTYYASEIDKYAMQVTMKNYPNTSQLGDITKINASDFNKKIDLLIGGSPCQGFSFAGKQLNFNDPRSKLFFEYFRLLNETKPKYFLLENVKMKKEYEDVITEHLGVKPIQINSRLVSAQNRPRLYWTNIPNVLEPEDKGILLKDILDKDIPEKYFLSEKAVNKIEKSKFGREFATISSDKTRTLIAGYYKIPSDGIYYNDGNRKRRYTPTECEKLQTVDVGYTDCVSDTQRYKMLGNGWTVDVISHILKNIL
jgi:DNA-cytosine methyltransferase